MFTFNLSAGAVFCLGIATGIILGVVGIIVTAAIAVKKKK